MLFPYFCVYTYAPVCLCSHQIDASGQAWETGIIVFECCRFFMLCCKALRQQARPSMVTAAPLDLNLFSSETGQWELNLCCARIWSLKRKEGVGKAEGICCEILAKQQSYKTQLRNCPSICEGCWIMIQDKDTVRFPIPAVIYNFVTFIHVGLIPVYLYLCVLCIYKYMC